MWSDPKGSKHKLYLHRFEGKHRYVAVFDFPTTPGAVKSLTVKVIKRLMS